MAVELPDGRLLRVCDLCGKVDTAPRHSFGVPAGGGAFRAAPDDIVNKVLDAAPAEHRAQLLRELMDISSLDLHKGCCRDAGCPTGDCNAELAEVGDLLDDDLRDALTERGLRLQNQEG